MDQLNILRILKHGRKPENFGWSYINSQKNLPAEEKYNLISQIMRVAVSCTANIAEGYGRFHYQENIQFCRVSRGSMYEAQDHLISCLDNEYINKEEYENIWDLSLSAIKILDGYIRYLKKKLN